MKTICPNCLSLNDSNERGFKLSLFAGPVLIGTGFRTIGFGFEDYPYYFILIGLFMISIGIISTRHYFNKFSKVCPKCKYDNMPTITQPEGQKIIQENGMGIKDDSSHHCSNCGYGTDGCIQSKLESIVIITLGIISLPFSLVSAPATLFSLIGSLILIGTGSYGLWTNYTKVFTCPNCKNKTLVPVDSE